MTDYDVDLLISFIAGVVFACAVASYAVSMALLRGRRGS